MFRVAKSYCYTLKMGDGCVFWTGILALLLADVGGGVAKDDWWRVRLVVYYQGGLNLDLFPSLDFYMVNLKSFFWIFFFVFPTTI